MRTTFILFVIAQFYFFMSAAQDCTIKNRVFPDGSMYYYIEPLVFYRSGQDSLFGGVVTDKENFYLVLAPFPFPLKAKDNKLSKNNLDIVFTGNMHLELEYYDARYSKNDSALLRSYLIKKNQLDDLLNNEIEAVQMQVLSADPASTYHFKWNKAAVKDQLTCFLTRDKKN